MSNILQVRDPINSEKWISIPAIRGTSVYLSSDPTQIPATGTEHYGGWQWTIYDEKKAQELGDEYQGDTITVYNGAIANAVQVDGIGIHSGSSNIELEAVRYVQQSLSTAQKSIVRNNIGAMEIIAAGSTGQVIQSTGTNWEAASINQVPAITTSNYVLTVTPSETYDWCPIPAISSEELSALFNQEG